MTTTTTVTKHPQRGFSLTELMVVIAIIGVLTTVATWMPTEDKATARGFAEQVVGEIDMIRMRAIASRRWHRVVLTSRAAFVDVGDTTGMAMPTTWTQVRVVQAPRRIEVVALDTVTRSASGANPATGVGLTDQVLLFAPDGSSAPRTVYLADTRRAARYRVAIYRVTGTARVYDGW
jgi:prepilin-type N-terminal cleavage/methylation domain-containing protein